MSEMNVSKVELTLKNEEVQYILNTLSQCPYNQVSVLISNIVKQIKTQEVINEQNNSKSTTN